MNQKFPSVFITIGLSIFLLITCSCEGETQKAEPLSSTDTSYQTKEPEDAAERGVQPLVRPKEMDLFR